MKLQMTLVAAALVVGGCEGPKSSKTSSHATPQAQVVQISDELELARVRVSAAAEKRLGIALVRAKKLQINSRRSYPGVVVVPPQNLSLLVAPVTGVVTYLGPHPLAVGTEVTKGQPLFSFAPLLVDNYALGPTQLESLRTSRLAAEQSGAAIETRINNAEVELDAARVDLRRAEQLFEQKVGSRKRVDDAKARAQLAQEVLDSARREMKVLKRITSEPLPPPTPSPMSLTSPLMGTVSKVSVASGQSVTAGQPLLELINLERLWLRLRLPQAEASEIQRGEAATLNVFGRQIQAEPTSGPPTADPLASTLDLYFLLKRAAVSPDQRVEVSLPLRGTGQHLVVPAAAILYDVYGGAWVYVRTQPLTYQRVRVQIDHTTDKGQAVLISGPEPGVEVVTHGAAEIFGIEFGND